MRDMILNRFQWDNCTFRSNKHGRATSTTSVTIFTVAIPWKSAAWLMHWLGELHVHGFGIEHRKASANVDPTPHITITAINVPLAHMYWFDAIVLLNSSADESLLKATVTVRNICAAYSCLRNSTKLWFEMVDRLRPSPSVIASWTNMLWTRPRSCLSHSS